MILICIRPSARKTSKWLLYFHVWKQIHIDFHLYISISSVFMRIKLWIGENIELDFYFCKIAIIIIKINGINVYGNPNRIENLGIN